MRSAVFFIGRLPRARRVRCSSGQVQQQRFGEEAWLREHCHTDGLASVPEDELQWWRRRLSFPGIPGFDDLVCLGVDRVLRHTEDQAKAFDEALARHNWVRRCRLISA